MNWLIWPIIILGSVGIIAALVLYIVLIKFKVNEDPRIDDIEGILPGANCGGCGFAGCRNFAEACTKAGSLEDLRCPVGGDKAMTEIAKILGTEISAQEPKVAVLRCNTTCQNKIKTTDYTGAKSCKITNALYGGESACKFSCLGYGDCVNACQFDALSIDNETGRIIVDEDKCTACGKCVKACPKNIIELRKKGIKNRRVYVACSNKDKGALAIKACKNACIGCGKCAKTCQFNAITIKDNLAYIDANLCRLCKKCIEACPTKSIVSVNFPIKQAKADENI